MAWYRNHYHCGDCGTDWDDEWSCCCDDECPNCGSRNWSPVDSEDLTEVVDDVDGTFIVFYSPEVAEDKPRYQSLASFQTRDAAEQFLATRDL